MLFSSTIFIYFFLPIVIMAYYLLFYRSLFLKNLFLFAASIFFYGWGEPKFVLVMMLSIIVNWFFGLMVDRAKRKGSKIGIRLAIIATCIFDLGLLFVFKYLNFAESIICSIFGTSPVISKIVLPIGISFFTFQAMSYVLDVARGKGEVQKNILNVGLYIAFFPQLIAGPIVRYETVAYEIKNRRENTEDFFGGFSRFIIGLGKKVILSNNFALLADKAFELAPTDELSTAMAWLGAIAYTFQIFFDFSGYSDMAIGLGKMFGFHFLENFDYPYISHSITEFWRRWHISLGSWFRDYVYFPLGGSRVKKPRLVLNLFAVWALTGIWHGANWTFLVWGLMYFVLLCFEKLSGFNNWKIPNLLKWLYTMLFVILGWVIFRADSISDAMGYIGIMFGITGAGLADGIFTGYFTQSFVLLAIGAICSTPATKQLTRIKSGFVGDVIYAVALTALFALCISGLVSNSYNPFIYFNF
ncbi:MAG: MBOAT family protein [Eubacteriales bacterium]|nr:MBOAT family protein [Eubacteriales bacterium]